MISSANSWQQPTDAPWFAVELPVPTDLDKVTTVAATVLQSTVVLRAPAKRTLTQPATIEIRKRDRTGLQEYCSFSTRRIEAAIGVPVTLPPLQPDDYELEISVPVAEQMKVPFRTGRAIARSESPVRGAMFMLNLRNQTGCGMASGRSYSGTASPRNDIRIICRRTAGSLLAITTSMSRRLPRWRS